VLPKVGVLNAETRRSDICNIHEECVHLFGTLNWPQFFVIMHGISRLNVQVSALHRYTTTFSVQFLMSCGYFASLIVASVLSLQLRSKIRKRMPAGYTQLLRYMLKTSDWFPEEAETIWSPQEDMDNIFGDMYSSQGYCKHMCCVGWGLEGLGKGEMVENHPVVQKEDICCLVHSVY
jgi:hypothetical protein